MSLSATLTIDVSMIAMIRPSMTVSVTIARGGSALRAARRSADVGLRTPGAARDALMTRAPGLVSL